jgi:hypothetical protein
MNWKLCIDTPEQKALDLCYGSMKMGPGYGDGSGYGDGYGDGFGSGDVGGDGDGDGDYYGGLHGNGGGFSPEVW